MAKSKSRRQGAARTRTQETMAAVRGQRRAQHFANGGDMVQWKGGRAATFAGKRRQGPSVSDWD